MGDLESAFAKSGVANFEQIDDRTIQLSGMNLWIMASCWNTDNCPGEGNLIVGREHEWSTAIDSIAVGYHNSLGGIGNFLAGLHSSSDPTALCSSILGGQNNHVSNKTSTIIGGVRQKDVQEACLYG